MYILIGGVPYLSVYLWRSRGFTYRELHHTSSLAGILPETISLSNTHCVPTHSPPPRAFPAMSGDPDASIQTRYTRPSSVIMTDKGTSN